MFFAQNVFSEDSRGRGVYFDLGFGGISYNQELDDALNLLGGLGVDRVTVYFDIGLGYAVTQNLYFLGSVSGFGDRLSSNTEWMQFNTFLYGLGQNRPRRRRPKSIAKKLKTLVRTPT
ncbi:MAG TPA: hypothetical protein VFC68_05515 [Treponemataceae bacterium]|nr:hypothetical protein [Treponemataceae bacterium]